MSLVGVRCHPPPRWWECFYEIHACLFHAHCELRYDDKFFPLYKQVRSIRVFFDFHGHARHTASTATIEDTTGACSLDQDGDYLRHTRLLKPVPLPHVLMKKRVSINKTVEIDQFLQYCGSWLGPAGSFAWCGRLRPIDLHDP